MVITYDWGGGQRENGGVIEKTSCVGWGSKKLFNSGGEVKNSIEALNFK